MIGVKKMVNGGVLVSQDLSCAGQVSLSAALPVLGACGLSPTVLPTAILSTHTGGFGENTFLSLNNEMAKIMAHWQKVGFDFSAVYLGYLGKSALDFWTEKISYFKQKNKLILIDPVMGDHGQLYRGIDENYVIKMRNLVKSATILTPNMTEAAFLLGKKATSNSLKTATEFAAELSSQFGVPNVIITGISLNKEKIAEVGITANHSWSLIQKKLPGNYFGTGDLFASAFFAAVMHKENLEKACSIAADFVAQAIRETPKQDSRLGPNYAAALSDLLKRWSNN